MKKENIKEKKHEPKIEKETKTRDTKNFTENKKHRKTKEQKEKGTERKRI